MATWRFRCPARSHIAHRRRRDLDYDGLHGEESARGLGLYAFAHTGVSTEQFNQAPRALRESLIFPYLQGSRMGHRRLQA